LQLFALQHSLRHHCPNEKSVVFSEIDLLIGTKLVSDYTVGAAGVTDFTSHEGTDEVKGMTLMYAATTVCGLVVLAIISCGSFTVPQVAPHLLFTNSPFVPTLAYYHNFLQDSILLACDIVTMFLMQAVVCLIFDALHVDNESCERYSRQDDRQQNYILPYLFGDRLGERCVWNEDTANCEIRDAQSSLWTLVLRLYCVFSIPFTRLTRLLFLEYIFVPTLKNPSTSLNWLLHFLPAS
jgi:hypothetical protein